MDRPSVAYIPQLQTATANLIEVQSCIHSPNTLSVYIHICSSLFPFFTTPIGISHNLVEPHLISTLLPCIHSLQLLYQAFGIIFQQGSESEREREREGERGRDIFPPSQSCVAGQVCLYINKTSFILGLIEWEGGRGNHIWQISCACMYINK